MKDVCWSPDSEPSEVYEVRKDSSSKTSHTNDECQKTSKLHEDATIRSNSNLE